MCDTPCGDPLGYEVRVGCEDHGQVRKDHVLVDSQEEVSWDTVELLKDERGGQVAVAEHQLTGSQGRVDHRLDVFVSVCGHKARERQPVELVGVTAGEAAQIAGGRFDGLPDRAAVCSEVLVEYSDGR